MFIIKDRISGVTVLENWNDNIATFRNLEDAERVLSGINHYVNTDYYIEEL